MGKVKNLISKFAIGIVVNFFAVISALLNVWEFIRLLIIRTIAKIPETFNALITVASVIFTIYLIFTPDIDSIGTKLFVFVMVYFVLGLLIKFSEVVVNIISAIALFVIGILDSTYIICFMRDSIMSLVDKYLNYCEIDLKTIDRIWVFGICYTLNFISKIFRSIKKVSSIIIYPVFAFVCGALGYILFSLGGYPPVLWSLNWWLCLIVTLVSVIIGVYLAFIFNKTVEETIACTDFDLFYVFEVYSETFRNFSAKNTYEGKNYSNFSQTEETNPYYSILSSASSYDELKRMYRKLAKEVHPDVSTLSAEEACKNMANLNEAYTYYQNTFR